MTSATERPESPSAASPASPASPPSEEYLALVERLNRFAHAYYVLDAPLVPDAEYDRLYHRLQELEATRPPCTAWPTPSARRPSPPSTSASAPPTPPPASPATSWSPSWTG